MKCCMASFGVAMFRQSNEMCFKKALWISERKNTRNNFFT